MKQTNEPDYKQKYEELLKEYKISLLAVQKMSRTIINWFSRFIETEDYRANIIAMVDNIAIAKDIHKQAEDELLNL